MAMDFRSNLRFKFHDDAISLTVGKDGKCLCRLSGQSETAEPGADSVVPFINPQGCRKSAITCLLRPRLWCARYSVPGEEGRGQIVQGFSEFSNVQVVESW
jgi:flagellar basal body rod protein FlgG